MTTSGTKTLFDIDLGLRETHVLVTGGLGLIGRVVVRAFLAAGCRVSVIDLPQELPTEMSEQQNLQVYFGDITKDIIPLFARMEDRWGTVQCCVALASIDLSSLQQTETICDMDPAVWTKVIGTNVTGTFLTCQRWLQGIRTATEDVEKLDQMKNVSLIIMGSESGAFGVRTMAAYAAGKSAVQYGLMRSLAMDAPRIYPKARVNAVAPGAVDTERFHRECEQFGDGWKWAECEATVGLAKPVPPEHVARTFLMLASERFSGSTHGQVLHVDGGKTGTMVWPKDDLAKRESMM